MTRTFRALVYGDVDLNVIDGSAIWLQSLVRLLHRIPRADVTLQLKRNPQRDILTAPLEALDRVRIVSQPPNQGRRLLTDRAPEVLAERDAEAGPFDAIFLRGYRLCLGCARHERLAGRLWCYLTDFPQDSDDLHDEQRGELGAIASASRYMLCQTDEVRSYLETYVEASRGRTALLRSAIDDMPAEPPLGFGGPRGARIVYAGKFARRWRTEELIGALPALRKAVPSAEVVAIGDKIHDDIDDPGFAARMRNALERTPGVQWLGALPRDEVQDVLTGADFGYSVRDRSLDSSLELSTKVLEYGRAGLAVLLGRTPMHERLVGADYPLFAADGEDLADRIREVLDEPALYRLAAERMWAAAREHTFEAIAEDLRALVDQACPMPAVEVREQRNVLVVGHDLKFATPLLDHLAALPDIELRVEQWSGINAHEEETSRTNLAWADAILAEWCLANAVWLAEHRTPGQRLVTRFHRFEIETQYPAQLQPGGVDRVAFVGPHMLRQAAARMSVPEQAMCVVPNLVPSAHLKRPKLPGAKFNLGVLGMSPWLKRLDLAVETLRLLRQEDERFTLFVKGHLPIDSWWVWGKERDQYLEVTDALARDPLVRESVVFDHFGSDVAEWFRKIGNILSPSDIESFHLALSEGIASGSVPIIWGWEGAEEIYAGEQLLLSPAEAAQRILEAVATSEHEQREREALAAPSNRELMEVCSEWERLLLAPL